MTARGARSRRCPTACRDWAHSRHHRLPVRAALSGADARLHAQSAAVAEIAADHIAACFSPASRRNDPVPAVAPRLAPNTEPPLLEVTGLRKTFVVDNGYCSRRTASPR